MCAAQDDMPPTLNVKADGYRGIWYAIGRLDNEYAWKYSGGLGTYCAKHSPFAVHRPEAGKTFFCYGGTSEDGSLLHMVGYYDHEAGIVPRPTVLLDKQTGDAHDNPVLAVDDEGHVWVFSTSHGTERPSFIHRSVRPYDIAEFERVHATRREGSRDVPFDNFSYFQVRHLPDRGFAAFMTRYGNPAQRTIGFITSPDGAEWSQWQRLAAIQKGHYQVGRVTPERAGTAFNYHPEPAGLDARTNLYYLQTGDNGTTWTNAAGETMEVPLTEVKNDALVRDYESEGRNVYLKDTRFDAEGRPVLLYLTSRGHEPGPQNAPRTWTLARWTGSEWIFNEVTTSDNNYDMGSLYVGPEGPWRIIAPTEPGPQAFNPGGEVAVWESNDRGTTWRRAAQITRESEFNHTYVRRPVGAAPEFCALWADGHGREPSDSRLYFCNHAGRVYRLPVRMDGETARPERVEPAAQ